MKKSLFTLTALVLTLMSHPALADGGNWDDGSGCEGDGLLGLIVVVLAFLTIIVVSFFVNDIYKHGKETGLWPLPHFVEWFLSYKKWQDIQSEKTHKEWEEMKRRRNRN